MVVVPGSSAGELNVVVVVPGSSAGEVTIAVVVVIVVPGS